MRKKSYIIFAFMAISIFLSGQSIKKNLFSANSFYFHHQTYVFGYQQNNHALIFKCLSYSNTLMLKDSVELNLGNYIPSNYLAISSDTLHGVLNFYFQLADEKNKTTLLRLNDSLEKICLVENFDANRVNSLIAFGNETYIYKTELYTIRTVADTSGIQFYLSKYHVKSIQKPFEYDLKWQYAFDKKYIHTASVIYADSLTVMAYVNIMDGLKKGQWILKLNATTGDVIKGAKLNPKGDIRHYLYSNCVYNPKIKSLVVAGSIYPAQTIDFKHKTADHSLSSKTHQLFVVTMDSLGEAISRMEKALPIPATVSKETIAAGSSHFKIRNMSLAGNTLEILADIYTMNKSKTLAYLSSWKIILSNKETGYEMTSSLVTATTSKIPNFMSYSKGDSYGKFFLDNTVTYDQFKYRKPMNDVLVTATTDSLNNPLYILKKTDILKGSNTYYEVFTGKKGLENKIILTSKAGQNSQLYFTNKTTYISFLNYPETQQFELKLNHL